MRKKLIAGNWKMNLDWNEAMTLFAELIQYEKSNDTHADIAVFPPSLYLRHFYELAQDRKSSISVGAQDCSAQVKGAYTGELAASMIHSVGAKYCLVGHSERREYHRESNDILSEKVERLLEADIIPVFCCGESLADRDSDNQTFVSRQPIGRHHLRIVSTEQFETGCDRLRTGLGDWYRADSRVQSKPRTCTAFIRGLVQSKYGESCRL